jgi:hypothetical protein
MDSSRWDDLHGVLIELGQGVAADSPARVAAAMQEVDRLRPGRVAPLPADPHAVPDRVPLPVPEHVNKLIHDIEHALSMGSGGPTGGASSEGQ